MKKIKIGLFIMALFMLSAESVAMDRPEGAQGEDQGLMARYVPGWITVQPYIPSWHYAPAVGAGLYQLLLKNVPGM